MNFSPFLSVDRSCDVALQWTNKQLTLAGLRMVQTFDLHTARSGLHACSCPNHGTEACDCQMVVLLVYGSTRDISVSPNANPITLILHGNDGCTWLSIVDTPQERADANLMAQIKRALENASVSMK